MGTYVRAAIKEELVWFAFILFVGLIIGFLVDKIAWGLGIALVAYIFIHFRQAWKVLTWLLSGKLASAPSTYGIWGAFVRQAVGAERKAQKRKKRLSASVKRFHSVLAAMPDAIVILDEFGGVEWFNESARRILRMKQGSDIGQHITRSIEEKHFTHYYNKKDYDHSISVRSPFDSDISLNIRIAPYGKKKQLLSARDITRMRQLEGVRSLFVANVSHELRTPLTVISGYLELLSNSDLDSAGTGSESSELISSFPTIFEQMSQQADRMTSLLDDLLMLSNLENQQATAATNENVCIGKMVKDIHQEAKILQRDESYTISCDIDEQLAIKGNAKEIHSAFTNLVTNALRYTPSGGEIKISWKKEGQRACFRVCDNGIGIESKHIDRLTERFYRVDKGRSRGTGGTGLGLAIVKHVLYKYDANLEVESTFGEGSCFTCVFPENCVSLLE